MADVLLVAATEIELCEHPGLVCGVGPVEAAAATARELASHVPSDRSCTSASPAHAASRPGVSSSAASRCTATSPPRSPSSTESSPTRAAREGASAAPDALVLPIGTSAAVGGLAGERPACRGDGGIRRPAGMRARGRAGGRDPGDLERALRGRSLALAHRSRARGALGRAPRRARGGSGVASSPHGARGRSARSDPCRRRFRRRSAPSGSSSARRSGRTDALLAGLALGVPVVVANGLVWRRSADGRGWCCPR